MPDVLPPTGTERPLNTNDLELFSERLNRRFDRLDDKLDRIESWQTERDIRIERNATDIKELRDWKHDFVNQITSMDLRTAPLNVTTSAFLADNIDVLKNLIRLSMEKDATRREIAIGQRVAYIGAAATFIIFVVSQILPYFHH